ncbi:helix-turn-helix transcriptional regulator [Sphingobium phenoxybenzoativorans]|uniref:Helix-turn-helix transcriptional regulator n=1 Tax=Sphingobium phenoxybenzoativorans TaxID=1592790 RepID=A0A975K356_9SPHN|nr:helix-turn-helix transcriptional regulator [Sphingobium phenoxybenzoativorans]QUT04026.1 helix-turn-helix transcriptional regulator [Sphingobium phenoxybenzoativorans]
MQLRAYRKLTGLTLDQVAEIVGVANASVVSRHERGVQRPETETVEKYRDLTDGAVTERDWHELSLQVREKSSAAEPQTKEASSA